MFFWSLFFRYCICSENGGFKNTWVCETKAFEIQAFSVPKQCSKILTSNTNTNIVFGMKDIRTKYGAVPDNAIIIQNSLDPLFLRLPYFFQERMHFVVQRFRLL